MKKKTGFYSILILLLVQVVAISGEYPAKIVTIEGNASILRTGSDKWRPAKPNTMLKVGDQLFSREESFVEIRYVTGAVLRMAELSKVVIEKFDDKGVATRTGVGNVWVNMKKLVKKGTEFELMTPTATAAIRGTVFNATTSKDSSTDVAVFSGTVAVGASDILAKKLKKKSVAPAGITEVPGPEEIPGPFEVSLNEWKSIVAGQVITVRKDGKFAQKKFDPETVAKQDSFTKRNLALDKILMQEK